MRTWAEACAFWQAGGDTPDTHEKIYDVFTAAMQADPELLAHRVHVETNGLGMGCRAFSWLWKLIIESMPTVFNLLETGVHLGQAVTLVTLLARRFNKVANVIGVSTFDGREVNENGSDYRQLTINHFDLYGLRHPHLIAGDSTAPGIVAQAAVFSPYDVVYVDGGHTFEVARADVVNYGAMVRAGGLLLVDDSANRFNLPPCHDGELHFHGIQPVSDAVDSLLPPHGPGVLPDGSRWEQVFVCMHIRCFRRTA